MLRQSGIAEGLLLCPEGAATWAAYKDALARGLVTAERYESYRKLYEELS